MRSRTTTVAFLSVLTETWTIKHNVATNDQDYSISNANASIIGNTKFRALKGLEICHVSRTALYTGGRLDDLVQHILDLEEHQRVSRDPNFRVRGQDQVDPFQPEDPHLSVKWAAAHGPTPPS
ncbi:unnamed protein product [Boreogadus saida]